MNEILSTFHHIHHLGIQYDSEHHEVHHCGGNHEGMDYIIEHCKCGKHAIDKEEAVGHNFYDNEVTYMFDSPCPDKGSGYWHIESGSRLLSRGELTRGDIIEFSYQDEEDSPLRFGIGMAGVGDFLTDYKEKGSKLLVGIYFKSVDCCNYSRVEIQVKGCSGLSGFKRKHGIPIRVKLVGKVQDLLNKFEISKDV